MQSGQAAGNYTSKSSYPVPDISDAIEGRDPRETGNMFSRLQVAEELVADLRNRLTLLTDRMFESQIINGLAKEQLKKPFVSLLQLPDNIIADARCADSQINRIEGALGI